MLYATQTATSYNRNRPKSEEYQTDPKTRVKALLQLKNGKPFLQLEIENTHYQYSSSQRKARYKVICVSSLELTYPSVPNALIRAEGEASEGPTGAFLYKDCCTHRPIEAGMEVICPPIKTALVRARKH